MTNSSVVELYEDIEPAASDASAVAKLPSKNILIAIPCGAGGPAYTTFVSCANAAREAAIMGWNTMLMARAMDSILVRARDVLVSQFYADEQYTDLLLVDSDIAWDPGVFAKIMSHPVDFVGGVYCARGEIPDYVCRPLDGGHIDVMYPSGLAEVRGVGTGFLRLTRKAVSDLIEHEKYRDNWYTDRTAPGLKVYHLFDFVYDPGKHCLFSEDYVFCDRYREIGGKVYADVELGLHHEGQKTWSGHFGNFLRQQAAIMRPETTLDAAKRYLKEAA